MNPKISKLNMNHILKIFLLLQISFGFILCQDDNSNFCTSQVECSDCIQSGGSCAWCGDEDFKIQDDLRARCDFSSNLQGCKNLTNPIKIITIPANKNETLGPTMLINPQAVKLKLRPGQASVFQLNVRPAENYPVDLYYLMDLSYSMRDDLQKLKALGSGIADAIDKISNNYRLGFGSFVEKKVSPFIQIAVEKPCSQCEIPYGYIHSLNFTNNATLFATEVNKLSYSGNMDNPEAGLDAFMQTAVCEKELDWRSPLQARKIIVYVSDASFHIAGDGKLGGIVLPNDYQCHLSGGATPTYTKSKTQDYPSVGLLKKILQEKKIVPIIAVTSYVGAVYKGLAEEWKDLGATVGTLASDSSNVVQLIADAYTKISSTISLNDNSNSYIQVEYSTIVCRDGTLNECRGVANGETVTFEVSVTATSAACSDALKNETKNFQIRIPGFGDVHVDVEVLCECECEKPPLAEKNSDQCYFGNGTFACGQCNCNEGRFGDTCSCTSAESVDESLCRKNPNDTSEAFCSGLGSCICGKCECQKRPNPSEKITGRYCECTNFGCDRDNGKSCGGPGHGRCECNKCACEGIWTGSNCGTKNCTKVEPDCFKNGEICSDSGKCDCGICNCDKGYKGKHCEDCPTCPGQCAKRQDCVLCQAFQKGDPAVCANCSLNVIVVNGTIDEKCRFQDADECFYVFTYGEDVISGNITYTVQKTKKCFPVVVENAEVLGIVFGTIGGILLFGLIALLIWKLSVSAYDKFQYKQFEKERAKSKWEKDQNPLYKSSQQKYDNPAYIGEK